MKRVKNAIVFLAGMLCVAHAGVQTDQSREGAKGAPEQEGDNVSQHEKMRMEQLGFFNRLGTYRNESSKNLGIREQGNIHKLYRAYMVEGVLAGIKLVSRHIDMRMLGYDDEVLLYQSIMVRMTALRESKHSEENAAYWQLRNRLQTKYIGTHGLYQEMRGNRGPHYMKRHELIIVLYDLVREWGKSESPAYKKAADIINEVLEVHFASNSSKAPRNWGLRQDRLMTGELSSVVQDRSLSYKGVMHILQYGDYETFQESGYDAVNWPYTEPRFLWFQESSGKVRFDAPHPEGYDQRKAEAFIKEEYDKHKSPESYVDKLEWLRRVYDAAGVTDDAARLRILCLQAYASRDDKASSDAYRKKAINLGMAMYEDLPDGELRAQVCFVVLSYSTMLGQEELAQSALENLIKIEWQYEHTMFTYTRYTHFHVRAYYLSLYYDIKNGLYKKNYLTEFKCGELSILDDQIKGFNKNILLLNVLESLAGEREYFGRERDKELAKDLDEFRLEWGIKFQHAAALDAQDLAKVEKQFHQAYKSLILELESSKSESERNWASMMRNAIIVVTELDYNAKKQRWLRQNRGY